MKTWVTVLATLLSLLVAGPAVGDSDPLANIDASLNRWKTLDYMYSIATSKKNGDKTGMTIRVRMKATDSHSKQMTEIKTGPGALIGTKVLIKSPSQMYVYIPAMKKVRRIASHVNDQPFLSTALSADDMNITSYRKVYEVTKKKDAGEFLFLKLTAKSDDAPYPMMKLKVNKKLWLPVETIMYNADGKAIKREERTYSDKCEAGKFCSPALIDFKNKTTGLHTVLMLTSAQVDAKIDDDIFTKRYLVK